jgi:hypothetical protein
MIAKYIASFVWVCFILLFPCYAEQVELGVDLATTLPAQQTNRSCQSYALAVALHQADTRFLFQIDGETQERLAVSLGQLEERIRKQIEIIKGERGASNRDDWDKAIRKVSGNQYKVHHFWINGQQKFDDFLVSHFQQGSACEDVTKACFITKIKRAMGKHVPPIVLVSVKSVEKSIYSTGHIVGIVDANPRATLLPGNNLPLRILNSAARNTAYTCLAERTGVVHWTNDYKLKYLNVAMVVPVGTE